MSNVVEWNRPQQWASGVGLLFAVPATIMSAAISALAGWDRGAVLTERLVWSAVGVLSVFAAHGLLATCFRSSRPLKVAAVVLWFPCMAFVANTHASYYLLAQQEAGLRRAGSIHDQALLQQPKRSLQLILAEEGRLRAQAAAIELKACVDDCVDRKSRKILLEGRANALVAEADEVRRWLASQDRQEQVRELVQADPVAVRLASALGFPAEQIGLVSALSVFVILDLVACYGWCLYGYHRSRVDTDAAKDSDLVPDALVEVGATPPPPQSESSHELSSDELSVLAEVRAGRMRLTIKSIREYLRCGQEKASQIRRRLDVVGELPA